MHDTKGFTLIELMFTLAIAGVLIAVAAPSFTQMVIKNRLNSVSSELADVSSISRSEAIKRNRTITFCRAEDATKAVCKDGTNWELCLIIQNSQFVPSLQTALVASSARQKVTVRLRFIASEREMLDTSASSLRTQNG